MQWIKDNAKWLIPVVSLVLGAVGAAVGVKFTVKSDPAVTTPEVIIILPESEPAPFVMGAADSPRLGLLRLRVRAASKLAEEQGWTGAAGFVKAFRCCQKVTDDQIVGCAIQAGFDPGPGVGAPGDFLRKLIEWISDPANQERIMKLIEFIMKLAVLFA